SMLPAGIYVSTDGGDTWIQDPGVGLTNSLIWALAVGGSGLPPSGAPASFLDTLGLGWVARADLWSFWHTARAVAAGEPDPVLLFGGAQPDGGAAGVF